MCFPKAVGKTSKGIVRQAALSIGTVGLQSVDVLKTTRYHPSHHSCGRLWAADTEQHSMWAELPGQKGGAALLFLAVFGQACL